MDRNIRDLKKVFAALDGDNLEQQVNQKAKDEISEDSIANTLKLNGELTTVIGMFAATSTDPGLRSIQKQCESFRTGGNQYDKAKQDVKAGKYLDAKMKVEQSNAKAAGYVGIWKKAWDPKEVGDFKQRTASKTTNEAKLAQTIGDDDYLQKMLVIKKIMEKNGFDPANLPIKIEQAVALFGYTTEDFNMLNPILRGYRPKHKKDVSDEEWEKVKKSYEVYIASINDGLAGLPAVNDWVYRGTPLDVLDKINGNSFSDKAFVSSSSTKSFLGDMQWIIESRGVGRDVAKLSLYPEGEVLFPSGTKFAVKALAAVVDAHDPDYAGITKTVKPADCYATLDALKQAVPAIASHDKVKAGKVFVVMSAG